MEASRGTRKFADSKAYETANLKVARSQDLLRLSKMLLLQYRVSIAYLSATSWIQSYSSCACHTTAATITTAVTKRNERANPVHACELL